MEVALVENLKRGYVGVDPYCEQSTFKYCTQIVQYINDRMEEQCTTLIKII